MSKLEEVGLIILFKKDYEYKGHWFEITGCIDKNDLTTIIISKNKKPAHYINVDGWTLSNKVLLRMAKICIRDLIDD